MTHTNENPVNAFTAACQRMHDLTTICHNWLLITDPRLTMAVPYETGCMRSLRLARLKPVTHEVTTQSALQLVVIPAQFDDVRHQGYERPRWQVLVYSWLGRDITRRLIAHLHSKTDLSGCTFFLVHSKDCERL